MANFRIQKVEQQINHIVSELILTGEVKDHRVSTLLSITSVEVSRDLAYAKLGVSAYLDETRLKEAVEGLNSAAGFMQHILGKRMQTRNTPKLSFHVDQGISKGFEVTRRLRDLHISDDTAGNSDD